MATKITTRVLADDAVTDAKLADAITSTTQSASDNTTKVATTAYVTTAIANLADSAPSTLNTLNELAAALGDDANYATTTTNAIAAKLPLAGGTLTGTLDVSSGNGDQLVLDNGGERFTQLTFQNNDSTKAAIWHDETDDTLTLYAASGRHVTIQAGASEKMRIDSAGTLFLGTTTPTTHSATRGIVFENGSIMTDITRGAGKSITLAQNASVDSGNTWAYLATDEATYYQQFGGNHYFATAASGTAGADITMSNKMVILNNGTVLIAADSAIGHANMDDLQVGDASGNRGIVIGSGSSSYGALAFADGSSGNEAYRGFVEYYHQEDSMRLGTSGTEKMRIGSTGKVSWSAGGIGNPATQDRDFTMYTEGASNGLDIRSNDYRLCFIGAGGSGGAGMDKGYLQLASEGTAVVALNANGVSYLNGGNLGLGTDNPTAKLHLYTSTADGINLGIQNSERYYNIETNDGYLKLIDVSAGSVERMRVHTDGEVVFNSSIADTYSPLVNGVTADAFVINRHSTAGSLGFWRTNTMEWKVYHNGQGYILTFGSDGVLDGDFNDTSDVNLKENISSISDGTTVIKALRPVKFDWKASGKGNNQHGFIAQEVETVLPDAVRGNDHVENETGLPEDEPAANGKSMNSNAVLAHAVKAIQELEARIKVLEG